MRSWEGRRIEKKRISIHAAGVFRVLNSRGQDITPLGGRPRALLAVVALSPRKVSARRWLESLFWADRASEQASGSLRQALSAIRRALDDHADILSADRQEVSLDAEATALDVEHEPDAALAVLRSGVQLLEGLDVPCDPFEEWLRNARRHWENKASAWTPAAAKTDSGTGAAFGTRPDEERAGSRDRRPVLVTETRSSGMQLEPFFAEAICAQIARTATEHVSVGVVSVDGQPVRAITAPGGRCTIRVTQNGDRMLALASLSRMPTGEALWSRQVSFDAKDELAAIDAAASLALEATEAFANHLGEVSDASLANSFAMTALQHVFSFDPRRLVEADALLEKAQQLHRHAPRPALRALAKAFLLVESSVGDLGELREEARKLMREAMAIDGNNALALAFLGDVHDLVFQDSQMALSLAERALQLDPGVGYAHASLGGLELKRGRHQQAFQSAGRARRQLQNTSLQVFSNMRFCLAAMNVGDFDAAHAAAERAAILAPNSRPPLRHLYVLKLKAGDLDGARETLRSLRRLEPDFSLYRIRNDRDYPADTIRRVGLDQLIDVDL
ncbi:MAG: hypothetical protein KF849_00825 [Rhizobiaceae bacterium]|nr:hypothetical protein [Rhizobiaceae bacterium]